MTKKKRQGKKNRSKKPCQNTGLTVQVRFKRLLLSTRGHCRATVQRNIHTLIHSEQDNDTRTHAHTQRERERERERGTLSGLDGPVTIVSSLSLLYIFVGDGQQCQQLPPILSEPMVPLVMPSICLQPVSVESRHFAHLIY